MKRLLLGFSIAAVCSTAAFAADDKVPVTINGCLRAGDGNSYVMTNVEEMSAGKMAPSSVVYWLSTTKGLKQRVGRQVEVTGTYSPSRDEGKTGTIKTETNPTTGEQKVAVENGAKKAETKVENAVGTTGSLKTEAKLPYRRLEVKTIKTIGEACR